MRTTSVVICFFACFLLSGPVVHADPGGSAGDSADFEAVYSTEEDNGGGSSSASFAAVAAPPGQPICRAVHGAPGCNGICGVECSMWLVSDSNLCIGTPPKPRRDRIPRRVIDALTKAYKDIVRSNAGFFPSDTNPGAGCCMRYPPPPGNKCMAIELDEKPGDWETSSSCFQLGGSSWVFITMRKFIGCETEKIELE